MPSTPSNRADVATPRWIRRPEYTQRAVLIIALTASAVELVRLVILAGPALAYVAVILGVAGVLTVRRMPWLGLSAASVASVVAGLGGWDPIVEFNVAILVLFAFAVLGRAVLVSTGIVAVLNYAAVVISAHVFFTAEAIAPVSGAIVAGAVASTMRSQRQYWGALEQRAANAVATRESEATRRVTEERLRIARDLHDVVGHQVAVLGIQLGAVEVSTAPHSETTRKALDAARISVKAILSETQHILAVLRDDDESDANGLRPAPGIADLETLIDSYRHIGLNVSASLIEPPIGIDPGVDVTVYRVVQEALTNAQRYGDGNADVTVALQDGRVSVDVSNSAGETPPADRSSRGFGLVGMRERVSSAGGTLRVGPDATGVFFVHAVLDAMGREVS